MPGAERDRGSAGDRVIYWVVVVVVVAVEARGGHGEVIVLGT